MIVDSWEDIIADVTAMIVSSGLYALPARAGHVRRGLGQPWRPAGGGPSVAGTDFESDSGYITIYISMYHLSASMYITLQILRYPYISMYLSDVLIKEYP